MTTADQSAEPVENRTTSAVVLRKAVCWIGGSLLIAVIYIGSAGPAAYACNRWSTPGGGALLGVTRFYVYGITFGMRVPFVVDRYTEFLNWCCVRGSLDRERDLEKRASVR